MLSFEFFYRFLLSRRAGSLVKTIARISILGVWLGVTALIVVVSVMNGFNRSIRDRLLEVEPHLVVHFDTQNKVNQIYDHPVYQQLNDMNPLLMTPTSHQDVILRTTDGKLQHAIASGVTKERLKQLFEYANKKADKVDDEIDQKIAQIQPGEVILGIGLADSIGLFKNDSVVLIPPETLLLPADEIPQLSRASVKGFLLTDVERIDGHTLYYLIGESFPRLQNGASQVLALEVWFKDPYWVDKMKSELVQTGLRVETWKDRNASLFFALRMEKLIVGFLVGLSTLIAGLSIVSVMVLLLAQKKKDVGNLLAMGMSPKDTKKTFVRIGLYLSMSGVVIGMVTGVLACLFIDQFSQDVLPAFYEETNIPAELQSLQLFAILVFSFLFSYTALQITMRKLTSYRPSDILRS